MAARKTTVVPEQVEHPLADLIPDADFAKEYISRTIHGVRDLDLLRYAHKSQKNVLLFGDTGPGKTAMVMAYCAEFRIPLVTVACNGGIDPNTFWGGMVPKDDGSGIRWQDSEVTIGIGHPGETCLYLDEPNFMPPKTSAVFHPLLDKRRFITIMEQGNRRVFADDGLFIVGSYNPGYQGTRPLNQAFKNRFKLKLPIDYSLEVESKLLCMPVMLEIADKLRSARRNGDLDTPTSTNMLMEFEDFAVDMGMGFAVDNFIAAFEPEEREAVRSVLELHMHDIGLQLDELNEG